VIGGACSTNGVEENAYLLLLGKPEEKTPRHRWVDNVRMDLRWFRVVWTGSVWLRIRTRVGFL
jgi:hypothetical protein